jgi:hypothetical protein
MVGEVLRHMVGVAESFAQQRPDVASSPALKAHGHWPRPEAVLGL